jgi:hypothetical protein
MRETDLYPLLKTYFEDKGFLVQAEVNNVDLVAQKDDLIIIVEMKTQLNLKLIYQGCQRQQISDNVYLAVPRINNKNTYKERLHILRRLNLGLLIVDLKKNSVEAAIDPTDFVLRRSKKKKQKLLKEMDQRITNINIGGTSKNKLVTSYREKVITIAYYMKDGQKTTKEIKELSGVNNATQYLQKNYYKWFERVSRGVYKLTKLGEKELHKYNDLFIELDLTKKE